MRRAMLRRTARSAREAPGHAAQGHPLTAAAAPLPELGIALATYREPSLEACLDATRAAGFRSVAVSSAGAQEWIDAGRSVAEVRRSIESAGLRVDYLDPLFLWLGSEASPFARLPSQRVLELTHELGGSGINIILGGRYDEAEAAEAFGAAAEAVARAGLTPMLEFAPFLAVANLDQAWSLVDRCGVTSAGVLVDVWHLQRSGGKAEDLAALPPGRIPTLHLSDAPAQAPEDLLDETMNGRLYPGDGAGRVRDVIAMALAASPHAVLTMEVYSATLQRCGPAQFAQHCFESAERVLRAALGGRAPGTRVPSAHSGTLK